MDEAPIEGVISVPLQEAQRRKLKKYEIPELVGDDDWRLEVGEHDLEAAWRGGLVDVHVLCGDDLPTTPAAPASERVAVTRH